MTSERDCRRVDSDECEIGMSKFVTERRRRGFAYGVQDRGSDSSFDSNTRADCAARGSVPGNAVGGARKKIPRARAVMGQRPANPARLRGCPCWHPALASLSLKRQSMGA